MSFFDLDLASPLVHAAHALGAAEPSAIQAQAIPVILDGRDLLGCAPTGSGKTLAYLLPLVQQWLHAGGQRRQVGFVRPLHTLVLVPTRELALQVHDTLSDLARGMREELRTRVAHGGVSINPQMMQMRGGADMLVATPGRLLDLVNHNAVRLQQVRHLVLDEADRLLDPGFAEEMDAVMALLPKQRQTLLLSATFPAHVAQFVTHAMRDPVRVDVAADLQGDADHHASSPAEIEQRAFAVDSTRRAQLLRQLLPDGSVKGQWARVLVFVAKRHTAEMLADKLYKNGVFATTFHGELSQGARQQVLEEFKAKRWQVLITTDLAARGIDIAQLPMVVNYDLPRSAADYVHRIGRTGRAGQKGQAISLVTPADAAHWALIQKRNRLDLPLEHIEGFEPTEVVALPPLVEQDGNGGVKGRRLSKKDKLRMAQAEATAATPSSGRNPS